MNRTTAIAIVTRIAGGAALIAFHEDWLTRAWPGAKRDAVAHATGAAAAAPTASLTPGASAPNSPDAATSQPGASSFNVPSLDAGARVESATSQYDPVESPATRLIETSAHGQWSSTSPPIYRQDLMFSFLGHQQVLIESVLINANTDDVPDRSAEDFAVWSSTESATTGFTQVVRFHKFAVRGSGVGKLDGRCDEEARYVRQGTEAHAC